MTKNVDLTIYESAWVFRRLSRKPRPIHDMPSYTHLSEGASFDDT